jgi:hypothetical protein
MSYSAVCQHSIAVKAPFMLVFGVIKINFTNN